MSIIVYIAMHYFYYSVIYEYISIHCSCFYCSIYVVTGIYSLSSMGCYCVLRAEVSALWVSTSSLCLFCIWSMQMRVLYLILNIIINNKYAYSYLQIFSLSLYTHLRLNLFSRIDSCLPILVHWFLVAINLDAVLLILPLFI